jgi:hypothetical protein
VHCWVRFWVMPMPTLLQFTTSSDTNSITKRGSPIWIQSQGSSSPKRWQCGWLKSLHVPLLATEMLVQSRRKACSTCQARKTKVAHLPSLICSCILIILQCDRAEPACQQCLRAGWVCPGYPERWKIQERKSEKGHECKSEPESARERVLL